MYIRMEPQTSLHSKLDYLLFLSDNENGIKILYASLDNIPHVRAVVGKAGSVASEAAPAVSLALPMTSLHLSFAMLLSSCKNSE